MRAASQPVWNLHGGDAQRSDAGQGEQRCAHPNARQVRARYPQGVNKSS